MQRPSQKTSANIGLLFDGLWGRNPQKFLINLSKRESRSWIKIYFSAESDHENYSESESDISSSYNSDGSFDSSNEGEFQEVNNNEVNNDENDNYIEFNPNEHGLNKLAFSALLSWLTAASKHPEKLFLFHHPPAVKSMQWQWCWRKIGNANHRGRKSYVI